MWYICLFAGLKTGQRSKNSSSPCRNLSEPTRAPGLSTTVRCHVLCATDLSVRFSPVIGQLDCDLRTGGYVFVSVPSLGGGAPGDTIQGGGTRTKKKLWLNLQRIVDKRGRTGKKGAGWHCPGGWHRSEMNKNDKRQCWPKKKSSVFWENK